MTILQDAYEQYRALGFVMHKSAKYKKHAYRTGAYIDRKNEPYDSTATGYVGIIPPNIIIVDNDKYEDGGKSFERLKADLNLPYEPKPFATTPSGGEHYAFKNPYETMVIGNLGDIYPALDIYSGYQSVIPLVGTTVVNKQGELASYEWADELFEELNVNPFDEKMVNVLKMRERASKDDTHYEEDNALELAIKADDMSDEEVDELLAILPDNVHYDDWLAVGMCLYDRYEASDIGLQKFLEFGARSPEKDEPNRTEAKWNNGHFKPTQTTYRRLRSLAHEAQLNSLNKRIDKAEKKDFDNIIDDISKLRYLNTRGKMDSVVREELSERINLRMKEVKKDEPSLKVKQARTILKELQHEMTVEELEESGEAEDMAIYLYGKAYTVRIGKKVVENLTEKAVTSHCASMGIHPMKSGAYFNRAVAISGFKTTTDYMLGKEVSFSIESEGVGVEELPYLVARKDPFHNVTSFIDDEEILDDFLNKIWNGKAQDIVEIIALTIRHGETKLNRLMTVAPSNTGKTEIYTMLGFQKITMKRLLNGLRGDKGIGSQVVDGIKNSGLLLIDETNDALEQEIKDLDKELYVDEFGAGGGTQKIKLHFTALTSTHKEATRNNSDELFNRFLQVELLESESEYHVTNSPVFQKNPDRYTEVVSSYLRYHFKQCLMGDQYTRQYLKSLQDRYRLPINSDLDEFVYEVSEKMVSNLKSVAGATGDVIVRQGEYYIKRKKDIHDSALDLLREVSSIDHAKYADKLTSHFITAPSKSVKVDGKPIKYYPLNMLTYTLDESQQITDMFDDLDIEEL